MLLESISSIIFFCVCYQQYYKNEEPETVVEGRRYPRL